MTEHAGFPLPAGRIRTESRQRRVVGKLQVVVSASGMLIALAMLTGGFWMEAGTVFLLTLGLLEILLQRALVLFHGGMRPRPVPRRAVGRETRRPATASE